MIAMPRPPSAPRETPDVAHRQGAERDGQRRREEGDEAGDAQDRGERGLARGAPVGALHLDGRPRPPADRRLGGPHRDLADADEVHDHRHQPTQKASMSRTPPRSRRRPRRLGEVVGGAARHARSGPRSPPRSRRAPPRRGGPTATVRERGRDQQHAPASAEDAHRRRRGRWWRSSAGRRGRVRWPGRPTGASATRTPAAAPQAPARRARGCSSGRSGRQSRPVELPAAAGARRGGRRLRGARDGATGTTRDDRRRAHLQDPHRGAHRLGAELPPEAPHAAVADPFTPPARRRAALEVAPRADGARREEERRPRRTVAGSCQWPYTTQLTGPVRRASAAWSPAR